MACDSDWVYMVFIIYFSENKKKNAFFFSCRGRFHNCLFTLRNPCPISTTAQAFTALLRWTMSRTARTRRCGCQWKRWRHATGGRRHRPGRRARCQENCPRCRRASCEMWTCLVRTRTTANIHAVCWVVRICNFMLTVFLMSPSEFMFGFFIEILTLQEAEMVANSCGFYSRIPVNG